MKNQCMFFGAAAKQQNSTENGDITLLIINVSIPETNETLKGSFTNFSALRDRNFSTENFDTSLPPYP